MPALDLALGLGMIRRAAHMLHVLYSSRRMSFRTCSAGALFGPDFYFMLLAATMNQKSSLREIPQLVGSSRSNRTSAPRKAGQALLLVC
jgi:hypothetical protein